MSSTACVDILMATCNGAEYVEEQVASLQMQTFEDWRLLVSDDCSNDGTIELVKRVAAVDDRVHVVSDGVRHGGAKDNFMWLLGQAEAPHVMFCDQDDAWLPEKIEVELARMLTLERDFGDDCPLLVFSDMAVVDQELKLIADSFEGMSRFDPHRTRFGQLVAHNVAAGCSMMLNRCLVRLCAHLRDYRNVHMHDWWAMLVASAFGYISYIAEPLTLYRQHEANQVGAHAYSPIDKMRRLDFMEEQFRITLAQAESFKDTYGTDMDATLREQLDTFISVGRENSAWGGVRSMIMSKCWKKGARKFGQLAMSMRVAQANRRCSAVS